MQPKGEFAPSVFTEQSQASQPKEEVKELMPSSEANSQFTFHNRYGSGPSPYSSGGSSGRQQVEVHYFDIRNKGQTQASGSP